MYLQDRISHHASLLEKSVKILIGFVSGFATEKPFFWQGMCVCPINNKNVIFKPYTLFEQFDSIEIFVPRQKEKGRIIINYKLFDCNFEEIINFLQILKKDILRLTSGEQINEHNLTSPYYMLEEQV
ncbi:MAG: hypothetical protein CH6_1735 [Candidatus Kapaibacterium sp.]|nr:MAG: hypothetical protein CH6_1735 [Candidatus Kapabacteria bacterium]